MSSIIRQEAKAGNQVGLMQEATWEQCELKMKGSVGTYTWQYGKKSPGMSVGLIKTPNSLCLNQGT